ATRQGTTIRTIDCPRPTRDVVRIQAAPGGPPRRSECRPQSQRSAPQDVPPPVAYNPSSIHFFSVSISSSETISETTRHFPAAERRGAPAASETRSRRQRLLLPKLVLGAHRCEPLSPRSTSNCRPSTGSHCFMV